MKDRVGQKLGYSRLMRLLGRGGFTDPPTQQRKRLLIVALVLLLIGGGIGVYGVVKAHRSGNTSRGNAWTLAHQPIDSPPDLRGVVWSGTQFVAVGGEGTGSVRTQTRSC